MAEFRKLVEGSRHLRWLPTLSHEEILPSTGAARLHVLASWFEVAPLVDLEAAVAGCRVVTTTHGHTSEYLGDWGVYWSPETRERGAADGDRAWPGAGAGSRGRGSASAPCSPGT